jgi:N-acyl-D-aspartate/D-glutamate deacylase
MPIESLRAGIPWTFETYPEYLHAVEQLGTVLNFGGYVGHTAVRMWVMGGEEAYTRAATATEIDRMRAVVAEALRDGALGFSTSSATTHQGDDGRPIPSRLADRDEVVALASALRDEQRGVGAFLPGELLTHEDVYWLQPQIGRPFTWTALVTLPGGYHEGLLALHDRGRAAGAAVWPQVSARPVVFQVTMAEPFNFQIAAPFAALLAVSHDERMARYRDPQWRRTALAALDALPVGRPRWDRMSVAESAAHPELEGRGVVEIADARGCTPLDAMLDVSLDEDLETRFTAIVANDDVAAIAGMLPRADLILGLSDAGAHVGQLCDASFATELLGTWVRERAVLSLEQAVRKLTGEVADVFDLRGRGYLRAGGAADIAVFDPATVSTGPTRRVTDFPGGASRLVADQPTGVVHVLVNGTPIRLDNRSLIDSLPRRPGMLLRSRRA